MAPPKKGPRGEDKIRLPRELLEELEELVRLHQTTKNHEFIEAIARYVDAHDPANCLSALCAAQRHRKLRKKVLE